MTIPNGFGSTTGGGPSDALLLSLTALAAASLLFAFFVLRPRTKGGKNGPPVVTTSPVCGLPVVGTIVEFGKSPVKMVKRCYDDYGPVFTVPVSFNVEYKVHFVLSTHTNITNVLVHLS